MFEKAKQAINAPNEIGMKNEVKNEIKKKEPYNEIVIPVKRTIKTFK